jgi:pilus assembly protein CpaC
VDFRRLCIRMPHALIAQARANLLPVRFRSRRALLCAAFFVSTAALLYAQQAYQPANRRDPLRAAPRHDYLPSAGHNRNSQLNPVRGQLPPGTRLVDYQVPTGGPVISPPNAPPGSNGVETMPGSPVRTEPLPSPVRNDADGRLSRLATLPPGLATPKASDETLRQYGRFVRRTVDPEVTFDVLVGRARVLEFDRAPRRFYLPDEQVARYDVIGETQVAVVGLTPGSTVMNVWVTDADAPGGERILSYLIRVLPDPQLKDHLDSVYRGLEAEINRSFRDSCVQLSLIGDQLVVRGQAKDAIEAEQILSVLANHAPRRNVSSGAPSEVSQASFVVEDGQTVVDFESERFRRERQRRFDDAGIINLIRIPGEQQVMLRVTVAEVNRTAARSIGLNFNINNDQGTSIFQSLAGNLAASGSSAGLSNVLASLDNGQVQLAINALRQLNLSRTLAEPTLTALNGKSASFQAGGQFPVPVVTGFTASGLQGVAFVPFGVQVGFTPYIVDRDRVRLVISAEVSTRDESLGTNVGGSSVAGGTSVAGLNTRNFQTTVELREGQTLAVAGLIQNNFGSSSDRVPLWGDLPFIGATGGYNRTSGGDQELVILVTPELVHPLEACETPPLPGSDVFEPTDIEFFIKNRLESRRSRDYRSTVRTDYHRLREPERFCEDRFLIGPAGQSYGCCGQSGAASCGCGVTPTSATERPGPPDAPTPR